MNKKIYIITGIVLFLIIILFFVFRKEENDIDPVVDDKDDVIYEISKERKREIEEKKDKDFYEENIIEYLGWTEKDFVEKHGRPDRVTQHYLGGEVFHYEEMNMSLLFSKEGVVSNISLSSGAEVLGVEVGMTFNQIKEILGEPTYGPDIDEHDGDYFMNYFLGDKTEDLGELELWISADERDGKTTRIDILWKKYSK